MAGGGLFGGLGALFGLAIMATAAMMLINVVGNMSRCSVCGYQNQNKQTVVRHIRTIHPREVAQYAQRRQAQRRPQRNYGWVW